MGAGRFVEGDKGFVLTFKNKRNLKEIEKEKEKKRMKKQQHLICIMRYL